MTATRELHRRMSAGAVIGTAAALLPPIAALQNKSVVPLMIVAFLAAVWLQRRERWVVPAAWEVPAAAVLVYALASAAWSLAPLTTLDHYVRYATTVIGGYALWAFAGRSEAGPGTIGRGLAIGIAAAVAIIVFDTLADGVLVRQVRRLPRPLPEQAFNAAATVLALAVWLAGLALVRAGRPLAAAAVVAVGAAGVFTAGSETAKVSLVVGALAWLACLGGGGRVRRGLGMAMVVAVLAMPLLAGAFAGSAMVRAQMAEVASSALHRLVIWSYAIEKIEERPLFGWGFESSRVLGAQAGKTPLPVRVRATGETVISDVDRLPLHPHNAALQIWLELGLTGAMLFAWWLLAILRAIERTGESEAGKTALVAMVVTAMVESAIGYGFWQSWWQASFWLLAMVATALVAPRRPTV